MDHGWPCEFSPSVPATRRPIKPPPVHSREGGTRGRTAIGRIVPLTQSERTGAHLPRLGGTVTSIREAGLHREAAGREAVWTVLLPGRQFRDRPMSFEEVT